MNRFYQIATAVLLSVTCSSSFSQTYPYIGITGATSPDITEYGLFGQSDVGLGLTSAHGGIGFWTGSGSGTALYETMRIWRGNVGIGMTDPQAKLNIRGGGAIIGTTAVSTNADCVLSIGNISTDYSPTNANWHSTGSTLLLSGLDYSSISFHDSGDRVDFIRSGKGFIQLGYDGGFGEASIGLPGGGIWNNGGNVGIGTLTPREKLSVNGTICAKEVKVEASPRPDFVFDKAYSLRSLDEVDEYIKVNKHLPEVPSAETVKAEGIA